MSAAILAMVCGLCCAMIGCTGGDEETTSEPLAPPDAEQDAFVVQESERGKADAQGIEELSWEGMCVLQFVNTAPESEIRDAVHSIPGKNIVAYRAGRDGAWGTADDQRFDDLEELDAVSFVGWITFGQLSRRAREKKSSYCLGLGEDVMLPGEQEATLQIAQRGSQHVEESKEKLGYAGRDAHVKGHGCVQAFVEVDPEALAPEERLGVFATAQTYPAWIRFSNGAFSIASDTEGDIRGMAVKLMGVPGEKLLKGHEQDTTHDFLLINGPTMFVRTPQDYVEFATKTFDGNPASFFLKLDPDEWHFRELFNLLGVVNKEPRDPLRARYWSTTPYRLGEVAAVKYSARPCDQEELEGWTGDDPEDLMRDSLGVHLSQTEGCFDFMIQRQLDPQRMPIEDATIEWEESQSPFIKVATIRVPMQQFDSPEQDAFCEHLSFNPWRSLEAHRPLGNINRVRRVVYDVISVLRHDLNARPEAEPTSHQLP